MTTVNMTETIISHVGMTQEAGAVRGPGLGKDRGIMIAADAMTATKKAAARDGCRKLRRFLQMRLDQSGVTNAHLFFLCVLKIFQIVSC
ncbi:unnamed protein product [Thlaspi arvense]|uniref:Uncharacterized protein n=1 Tax=Thlaspi arvense TaxID=13288 RepID=A0AAU9SXV7_THLAR|nr:unnamed protein product [Thlaspi arvense]